MVRIVRRLSLQYIDVLKYLRIRGFSSIQPDFITTSMSIVTADIDEGLAPRARTSLPLGTKQHEICDQRQGSRAKRDKIHVSCCVLHVAVLNNSEARTTMLNLLALVRRQPLYILLRVSRDLCFW